MSTGILIFCQEMYRAYTWGARYRKDMWKLMSPFFGLYRFYLYEFVDHIRKIYLNY